MIVEYDFTEFTEKDMFECKLKDITPDFGYITAAKRIPFLAFCIEFNFLQYVAEKGNDVGYKVLKEFTYESMRGDRNDKRAYSSRKVTAQLDDHLIYNHASRPNDHIRGVWIISEEEWVSRTKDKK